MTYVSVLTEAKPAAVKGAALTPPAMAVRAESSNVLAKTDWIDMLRIGRMFEMVCRRERERVSLKR